MLFRSFGSSAIAGTVNIITKEPIRNSGSFSHTISNFDGSGSFDNNTTLSAILGHYSVAFTMDTYVHSMDEHKRREMDKMDDMFGMQYSISVENQPYPVLCTLSADGCTAHVLDFPKVTAQAPTLEAALLEVKQQIEKALRQYKNPPIPTKQEQDRKSTRLNSSHNNQSRMPSSA